MNSMNDERFFDLAMKVIARQAGDAERAELDALRPHLEIGDDHLGTVPGKHPRRAFAQSRRTAGDDENLSRDLHFPFPFSLCSGERGKRPRVGPAISAGP